jgi:hypothetical protein
MRGSGAKNNNGKDNSAGAGTGNGGKKDEIAEMLKSLN